MLNMIFRKLQFFEKLNIMYLFPVFFIKLHVMYITRALLRQERTMNSLYHKREGGREGGREVRGGR